MRTLTCYDFFALRMIGANHVPYRIAVLASFTSYAIGHNIGATAFSGGAIRYRIYSQFGLGVIDVAKICFLTGLTFWLGNLVVLGSGMAYRPEGPRRILQLPPGIVRTIGIVALVLLAAYIVWVWLRPRSFGGNGWSVVLPGGLSTLIQVGIGLADLGFSSLAMYSLMPWGPGEDFFTLAVACVSATLLGFASHAPGSLGVFDAAMLVALPDIPKEELVAGLLVFRVLYFMMPFVSPSSPWRYGKRRCSSAAAAPRSRGSRWKQRKPRSRRRARRIRSHRREIAGVDRSPERTVVFQHGVEQHLRPGGAFLEGGRFRLVVADAAEARHEDHGGRRDARDIGGVVAGAGHDVARREAGLVGGVPHASDQFRREAHGRRRPDALLVVSQLAAVRGSPAARSRMRGFHPIDHLIVGMAQVDREEDLARNDIAAVRLVLDEADGRDRMRARTPARWHRSASMTRAAPSSAFCADASGSRRYGHPGR